MKSFPGRHRIIVALLIPLVLATLTESRGAQVQNDPEWELLQGYIQIIYSADLGRLPEISRDSADLLRNLSLTYGYVLGRMSEQAGDSAGARARVERLEELLHKALIDYASSGAMLLPSDDPVDIASLWGETQRAVAGDYDREAESLLRSIGGHIPAASSEEPGLVVPVRPEEDPVPGGDTNPDLAAEEGRPPTNDPGAMGIDDPRQERRFGEFEGELPENIVLKGEEPGSAQTLVLAIGLEDVVYMRELLEAGADPNLLDPATGMTPLMIVETGDMAAELLRHGADPRRADAAGATPLHHAVFTREAETVLELLLAHGADVNSVATGWEGQTPLLAARTLFIESTDQGKAARVMRLLAAHGGDPSAADDDGYTLLTSAAVNRNPELARLALELGTDPSLKSVDGLTALEYAIELGADEVVRLLKDGRGRDRFDEATAHEPTN